MSRTSPAIALLRLSDSFGAVWGDLVGEAGATVVEAGAESLPAGCLAMIVGAGGEERKALDLLPALREHWTGGPIFVVGAETSHRFAIDALRRGAADFFALPGDADLLRRTLGALVEAGRERVEARAAATEDPFRELIGESPALLTVLERARRVLRHGDVTVLIGGETGTGKELLARALHHGGDRRDGPFVAVNCAAIPGQLLESELFGHERGAFTDAHRAKPGLFEEADGGTLFLDEIGHLPVALQGKLLRALDERRVRRVGATQDRPVDTRIIAASHVDLRDAVRKGEFREDLFYRLNVVHFVLPPLRERAGDIVLLAQRFAESMASRYGLPTPAITAEVRTALLGHPWPGNVRELRHAVERALLLSSAGTLQADELTPTDVAPAPTGGLLPFPASLAHIVHEAAKAAVHQQDGNKSAAARMLGISRARLQRLLDRPEGDDADAS